MKPTHEEVAFYSYLIWEQEGRPNGRAFDHWLQAEAQLQAVQKMNNDHLEKDFLKALETSLHFPSNKKRTVVSKPKPKPTLKTKKVLTQYREPVLA